MRLLSVAIVAQAIFARITYARAFAALASGSMVCVGNIGSGSGHDLGNRNMKAQAGFQNSEHDAPVAAVENACLGGLAGVPPSLSDPAYL